MPPGVDSPIHPASYQPFLSLEHAKQAVQVRERSLSGFEALEQASESLMRRLHVM